MPKPRGRLPFGRYAVPKIRSTMGRPKFLSLASGSMAWCQWCHSGVLMTQRSPGNRSRTLACWKIASRVTNTATPAKVPPPYPRITSGITVNACVNAWSNGWSRPAAAQSIASMLWCTAWKRQRNGTVCVRRCPQ